MNQSADTAGTVRNAKTKVFESISTVMSISPARRRARTALATYVPTVLTVLLLLIIWEAWVRLAHVPATLLSAPSQIAVAAVHSWNSLWDATQVTLIEAGIGFVIACAVGVCVGVWLHCSRLARQTVLPLITGAQTLPLIAITPLFLIWFGFEINGKIVIVALFALFPIAVQTLRGLDAVPSYYIDVALTCGASQSWTLWHVKLRVAARQIFGGIRVAAAYTVATATTAEYLGARQGLGIWLQAAYNSFQTPLIFCAAIVIIIATALLLLLISVAEYLLLGPASEDEDPDADQF